MVGADGIVYCVDRNGTVCAVQDNGTSGFVVWAVHQPSAQTAWNYAEGAMSTDGEVVFVSDGDGRNVFLFLAPPDSTAATAATWPAISATRETGDTPFPAARRRPCSYL